MLFHRGKGATDGVGGETDRPDLTPRYGGVTRRKPGIIDLAYIYILRKGRAFPIYLPTSTLCLAARRGNTSRYTCLSMAGIALCANCVIKRPEREIFASLGSFQDKVVEDSNLLRLRAGDSDEVIR